MNDTQRELLNYKTDILHKKIIEYEELRDKYKSSIAELEEGILLNEKKIVELQENISN